MANLAFLSTSITVVLMLIITQPASAIESKAPSNGVATQQKPKPGKSNSQENTEELAEEEATSEEVSESPNKPPTRRTAKLLEKGIAGLATRLKVEPNEDGSVDGKKVGAKAACLAAKALPRGGKGIKC